MESFPNDRRKDLRVKVVASGASGAPTVQPPFTLRDLSLGGCSVESLNAFRIGDRHAFELTARGGYLTIMLTGEARHCRRLNHLDGGYSFLAGFEFDELTQDQRRVLEFMLRSQ